MKTVIELLELYIGSVQGLIDYLPAVLVVIFVILILLWFTKRNSRDLGE